MKNLDAYHDGLLAKHLAEEDDEWRVVTNDAEEGGYLVVDEDGEHDGIVYATWKRAKEEADKLNREGFNEYD